MLKNTVTSKNRPPRNLNSFSQLKTQIYANVAPRFEKAAALHQSNQVLALTTAILCSSWVKERVIAGVDDVDDPPVIRKLAEVA